MNTPLPVPEVQEISFVELVTFCLMRHPQFIKQLLELNKVKNVYLKPSVGGNFTLNQAH